MHKIKCQKELECVGKRSMEDKKGVDEMGIGYKFTKHRRLSSKFLLTDANTVKYCRYTGI